MSYIAPVLVTAPTREPVELQDLEYQLRLDIDYPQEQALLQTYITAARKMVERLTGRALMRQTWKYYMESWPDGDWFRLPYPPLISVSSIKYKDTDETESTWSSTEYLQDTVSEPGRVILAYGYTWPSETLSPKTPIYTEFICGYGSNRTDVPETLRVAIMQLVGHMYENRELSSVQSIIEVPYTLNFLIEDYRVSRFGVMP